MTERLRVSTSDGKYTVIQEADGDMKFLRHGEAWPAADAQFAHIGLILALAQDLAEARAELEALEDANEQHRMERNLLT